MKSLQQTRKEKVVLFMENKMLYSVVQPDWQLKGQEETKIPCQREKNKSTQAFLNVTKIKV